MKKLFLSVAIIATMASCSKNEEGGNPSQQKQIDFASLNDKVTRAANDSNSNYAVYAQYSTPTATWYINNVEVSAENVVTGDAHYWPIAELDFYAYAPHTSTNVVVAPVPPAASLGTLPITYTIPADAKEDFTVATPIKNQLSSTSTTVSFVFTHMLSRAKITAVLEESLTTDGYVLDLSAINASLTVTKNTGTVDATNPTPKLAVGANAAAAPTYTADAIANAAFLIMPHTDNAGCVVTIVGAKVTKEGHSDIPVALTYTFDANSAQKAFKGGTQYDLKFTVSLTKISFESTIVKWNEVIQNTIL